MNTDENDTHIERRGGPRPGSGRPRKGEPPRVKIKRRKIDRAFLQAQAEAGSSDDVAVVDAMRVKAEQDFRVHTFRKLLAAEEKVLKASGDLDGVGGKAEPEIPKHMLTRNGKLRKFNNMHACAMALINDPTVSVDTKAKLIIGLTQYEKPKLAEKPLGKKEERQAAAQTAGQGDEFNGLMELPKGPRLVVNGS